MNALAMATRYAEWLTPGEVSTVEDVALMRRVVGSALDRFGKLDILVNNAGITRDQLVMRMKRADWDTVMNTNLTSAYLCTQQVISPMLKQRWGRIINITSIFGQMGQAGQANYAASKAGLIGFTKSVARELASRNVTCNAVAPGFIATAEAHGHDNYKRKITAIDEEGTVVTRAVSGKPNRQIRNAFTREWETRQAEIEPFPIQYERVGKPASIRAREEGDVEHGSAAAGQSAGLVHDVRPAGLVVASIVEEAEAILRRLGARGGA